MSGETLTQDVEFNCPHCRARNPATLWPRIDAESAPEVMDQLFAGTLFDHVCINCHQPVSLDHTVLVEFGGLKIAILSAPPDDPLASAVEEEDAGLADYSLRRVTDSNALRELALIVRDGLDDAAMLLMKHMLAARVMSDRGEPPILCNYEARMHDGEREWLEYMLFQTEESEPETLTVPLSSYIELQDSATRFYPNILPQGQWVDWNDETARRLWDASQRQTASNEHI